MRKLFVIMVLAVVLLSLPGRSFAGFYDEMAEKVQSADQNKEENRKAEERAKKAKIKEAERLKDEEGMRSGRRNYKGYQSTLDFLTNLFNFELIKPELYIKRYTDCYENSPFCYRVNADLSGRISQAYPGSNINLNYGSGWFMMSGTEKIYLQYFKTIEYEVDNKGGLIYNIKKNGPQFTVTYKDYNNNYLTFRTNRNNPYMAEFIDARLQINAEISELGLGKKGTKFGQNELIRLLNVFYDANTIGLRMSDMAASLLLQPQYRRFFIEQGLDLVTKEREGN